MKIAYSKYSISRQINSRIQFSFSSILAEFCHMIPYEPTISRTTRLSMVSLIMLSTCLQSPSVALQLLDVVVQIHGVRIPERSSLDHLQTLYGPPNRHLYLLPTDCVLNMTKHLLLNSNKS